MISKIQSKLLEWVASGGLLESRRVYPFAPKYGLFASAELVEPASEVKEPTVRALVNNGLVKPAPQDKMWDRVTFEITPEGTRALDQFQKAKARTEERAA